MAESNWDELQGSADVSDIDRGVTSGGITSPPGGGTEVYGWNALTAAGGAVGRHQNNFGMVPFDRGGRITGAISRGVGAALGFSPMFFMALEGPSVNDEGYLLGLSDVASPHIVLKKGKIVDGISDVVGQDGVLAKSAKTVAAGVFVHLRFDVVVTGNGDIYLNIFESDLSVHDVTDPLWVPISGMDDLNPGSGRAFLDDVTGVLSGTPPFAPGWAGFAFTCTGEAQRAFVDHITVGRQS